MDDVAPDFQHIGDFGKNVSDFAVGERGQGTSPLKLIDGL